jgi:hypothetical protein
MRQTHFSWVEVLEWSWNMFCQRKGVEPFCYSCLHNFFQAIFCVPTELARVAVVGVRHIEQRLWTQDSVQFNVNGVFRM